uniref:Putative salivary secreted peptide n=1 Tax=Ixodes ricinus TaxID=34613 RepID=V5GN17_IXORI
MEIKWMQAYILLSILLVLGNAQKVNNSAKKALPAMKKDTTSKPIAAQKKAVGSKSQQAVPQKTAPKATAAPEPQAPIPSTDPIICELENNKSPLALPSLQCTVRELSKNLKDNLNKYMQTKGKNESDLLKEICEAKEKEENPAFMSNYTKDDKDMIHDTSTLCRIRHTTISECEMPNLIK